MGKVYSFEYWKSYNMLVDITAPCKPPFHKARNVDEDEEWCMRCQVEVYLTSHPSMKKPKWFGVES